MEIKEIMFETMKDTWQKMIVNFCDDICRKYETDDKYKLEKYYENNELMGFSVYYDTPEFRMLEAGYYIGKNKLQFFKSWRNMTKNIKVLRALIQKPNIRMIEFYKSMKFKIIGEDLNNYLFEKR